MSYLEQARKAKEEYRRQQQSAETPPATDPTEGRIVAVLIDSTLLGAEIWLALRDDWRPDVDDARAVFFASEMPFLQKMSPAELRKRHQQKIALRSGWIRSRKEHY